ncbi:hypothetical protein ACSS6W_000487 [Trichoderma asperelloides]
MGCAFASSPAPRSPCIPLLESVAPCFADTYKLNPRRFSARFVRHSLVRPPLVASPINLTPFPGIGLNLASKNRRRVCLLNGAPHLPFVMDTWMVHRYGASPALFRNPLATLEPMRRGLVQGTPRGVSGSRATMHLQERTVPWATVSDGFSGDTSR